MHCTHPLLYVRDAQDACVVMEAVRLGMLPLWTRRLNPDERQGIQPGNIYVWEEADEKGGLERWTDGRRWTQSRMRLDFLFYEETLPISEDERTSKKRMRSPEATGSNSSSRRHERPLKPNGLAKQTISMIVNDAGNAKRWHLVSYTSLDDRRYPIPLIEQYDYLRNIVVPDGIYLTTRGYPWNKKSLEESSMYDPDSGPSVSSPPSSYRGPSVQQHGFPDTPGASSSGAPFPSARLPSMSRDPRLSVVNTEQTDESLPASPKSYTPLTPEDRRALDSFSLRL